MRTHLEFRSSGFPAYPGEEEEINPGRYGKRLAEFLAKRLPGYGFHVTQINAEDWGWRIDLQHDDFPSASACLGRISEGFRGTHSATTPPTQLRLHRSLPENRVLWWRLYQERFLLDPWMSQTLCR